jgi:hypothetical protein
MDTFRNPYVLVVLKKQCPASQPNDCFCYRSSGKSIVGQSRSSGSVGWRRRPSTAALPDFHRGVAETSPRVATGHWERGRRGGDARCHSLKGENLFAHYRMQELNGTLETYVRTAANSMRRASLYPLLPEQAMSDRACKFFRQLADVGGHIPGKTVKRQHG